MPVISTWRPVSSRHSRTAASATVSPRFTAPVGMVHRSLSGRLLQQQPAALVADHDRGGRLTVGRLGRVGVLPVVDPALFWAHHARPTASCRCYGHAEGTAGEDDRGPAVPGTVA